MGKRILQVDHSNLCAINWTSSIVYGSMIATDCQKNLDNSPVSSANERMKRQDISLFHYRPVARSATRLISRGRDLTLKCMNCVEICVNSGQVLSTHRRKVWLLLRESQVHFRSAEDVSASSGRSSELWQTTRSSSRNPLSDSSQR